MSSEEVEDGGRWSCRSCTLLNPHTAESCDACGRRRHRGDGSNESKRGGRENNRGGFSPPPAAPGVSGAVVIDLVSGGSMETARNKKRKRRRISGDDGTAAVARGSGEPRRRGGPRDRGVIDVDSGDVSDGGGGVRLGDGGGTRRKGDDDAGDGGGGGGSIGGGVGSKSKSKSNSSGSKSKSSKSSGGNRRFFDIFTTASSRGDGGHREAGDDDGCEAARSKEKGAVDIIAGTTPVGSRNGRRREDDDGDGGGGPQRPGGGDGGSPRPFDADGTVPPSYSYSYSSSEAEAERRRRRRRGEDDGRDRHDVAGETRGGGGGGRSFDPPSASREAAETLSESHNRRNDGEEGAVGGRRRRLRGEDDDEATYRVAQRRNGYWTDDEEYRPRSSSTLPDNADTATANSGNSSQRPHPNHDIPYETLLSRSQSILRNTFKIPSLRNLQPTAVSNALRGKSQIIVMATGAGKSLCYQLPAATLPGLAVVISPLIALMQDQVRGLNSKGIRAALVCSANGAKENERILDSLRRRAAAGSVGVAGGGGEDATATTTVDRTTTNTTATTVAAERGGEIKMLYCTPELIDTSRFRSILSTLHSRSLISLVAIDEAHCLSTWGHDFRPAYRKLSSLRKILRDVPVMACTATATPNVIGDIRDCLGLREDDVPLYRGSFNRENISYEVRFKDSLDVLSPRGAIGDLIDVIKKQHSSASAAMAAAGSDDAGPRRGSGAEGAAAAAAPLEPCSGIVYVHKRADTTKLAHQITKATGIKAAAYHAGLSDSSRKQTQQQWTSGIIQVAVATVAFGMGIDLPHVRYVIHWTIAKSIEGFYQESGRGERDGKPALSILYYSKEDASKFSFLIKRTMESKRLKRQRDGHANQSRDKVSQEQDERSFDALQKMCDYCTKPCCKRQYLLKHFGETVDTSVCNKTCDYCLDPTKVEEAIRSSDVMKQVAKQASSYRSAGFGKAQGAPQKEWDGQWDCPHGSEGDDDVGDKNGDWDDFDDDGLAVYGNRTGSPHTNGTDRCALKGSKAGVAFADSRGFVKAKDVLAKYEMMECQEGNANGFVNFRNKKSDAPPVVQSHLRSENMPDPLSLSTNSQQKQVGGVNTGGRSSVEIGCEVERLKAELAQLKAKRATRLANHVADDSSPCDAVTSLGYKAKKAVVPAPPPPISFRTNTTKKKRK